jgi:hypothetical protein
MNRLSLMVNAAARSLGTMFPGFFPASKHNHSADFGYPDDVDFNLAYTMYQRHGIASAAIDKTVGKTWQDTPFVQEFERDGGEEGDQQETPIEEEIRKRFAKLRVWQQLAEADRRGLVGAYAGIVLRLADGKKFREPVDHVGGGLDGLVEVIPAWEGQLTVSQYDTDEESLTFGQPVMFAFNEAAVPGAKNPRNLIVHPDRVVIWSKDGTLNGRSALKPGFNALLDMEKVSGAGGEGFWKNAKSAPIFEIDKEAKLQDMAKAMGVPVDEVIDKMDEQAHDYNRGFDKSIVAQGMEVKFPQIQLPSPEHFFGVPLQIFAASMLIPLKILVGSQTGERASTEDASEWARTCMSGRTDRVIPNIMSFIDRLARFGILATKDWHLEWTDLTETSMSEKIDRAGKMADVNQKMEKTGEFVFTPEEIRDAVDMQPLKDADKYRDDAVDDDDEAAALGPAKVPAKPAPVKAPPKAA